MQQWGKKSQSLDYRRFEKFVKENLKEITIRMQVQEINISALNLQHNQIMIQLQSDQVGTQQIRVTQSADVQDQGALLCY